MTQATVLIMKFHRGISSRLAWKASSASLDVEKYGRAAGRDPWEADESMRGKEKIIFKNPNVWKLQKIRKQTHMQPVPPPCHSPMKGVLHVGLEEVESHPSFRPHKGMPWSIFSHLRLNHS